MAHHVLTHTLWPMPDCDQSLAVLSYSLLLSMSQQRSNIRREIASNIDLVCQARVSFTWREFDRSKPFEDRHPPLHVQGTCLHHNATINIPQMPASALRPLAPCLKRPPQSHLVSSLSIPTVGVPPRHNACKPCHEGMLAWLAGWPMGGLAGWPMGGL